MPEQHLAGSKPSKSLSLPILHLLVSRREHEKKPGHRKLKRPNRPLTSLTRLLVLPLSVERTRCLTKILAPSPVPPFPSQCTRVRKQVLLTPPPDTSGISSLALHLHGHWPRWCHLSTHLSSPRVSTTLLTPAL